MILVAPRWRVAGLLFVAAAINYLDRASLSITSPAIKQEFGMTDGEMGLVFSAFFVGYASMNIAGGWAADRFGAKRVLGISLIVWSFFCFLTIAARGFASLIVLRILFGAAEGPFGATSATVISRWFPKRELATAIAATSSGTATGAIVAGPLVASAFAMSGWRGALVAVSVLGLLFAAVWIRYAGEAARPHAGNGNVDGMDSRDSPSRTPADRPLAHGSKGAKAASGVLRYLRHPLIVANALAYFAYTYLLSIFLSWLPLYFTSTFHLELAGAAMSGSFPWVMALIGIWAGALLSDFVFRRTGRLLFARRVVQASALLVAGGGTATLGQVSSLSTAIGIASIALFALYLAGTSFWAVVQEVVRTGAVGTVSGFTHFVANLGGVVGPAVTGALVQHTTSFRAAWLVAGLVAVVAAGCVVGTARFEDDRISGRACVGA